jgi:hypothetical protein
MDRYQIFNKAEESNKREADDHLFAFVRSFVFKERQSRWLSLIEKRSDRAYRDSGKMLDHLDFSFSVRVGSIEILSGYKAGVYWEFHDQPVKVGPGEAFVLGMHRDAIYSLNPGRLALYFSHEGDVCLFAS